VGANTSPLSTAHSAGHGADGSSSPTDTYGGTPKNLGGSVSYK
jgi:hypothetical protein